MKDPASDRLVEKAFETYLETRDPKGHLEQVAQQLASGCGSRAELRSALAEDYAFAREDLLDLVIYFVGFCIADHVLTPEKVRAAARLRRLLGIEEGDLFSLRRREVEELVERELTHLLADGRIDARGAQYQAALQEVLGLGYDDWLKLTRPAFGRIAASLFDDLRTSGTPSEQDRKRLLDRLLGLDTFFVLSPQERDRLLGRPDRESAQPTKLRDERIN